MQLANAILPLVEDSKPLEDALTAYVTRYEAGWQKTMAAKLGLRAYDKDLVDRLLTLLRVSETDMTLFFFVRWLALPRILRSPLLHWRTVTTRRSF